MDLFVMNPGATQPSRACVANPFSGPRKHSPTRNVNGSAERLSLSYLRFALLRGAQRLSHPRRGASACDGRGLTCRTPKQPSAVLGTRVAWLRPVSVKI